MNYDTVTTWVMENWPSVALVVGVFLWLFVVPPLWRWAKRQPSKIDQLEAILSKPIAPKTPYGSKPSGEPEWRRALDELENTILPTLASHHERIAALEGAKPQAEASGDLSVVQWITRPTVVLANGVQQDYGPKAFVHSFCDDRHNDCWELHAGVGKTEFCACGHGKMPPLTDLCAYMEQLSRPQAEAPEWRVFRDSHAPFHIVCKDGWEVVLRLSNFGWETPNTPLPASCYERDWYTELHGPEKDAIVAAYLEWKGK